MSVYINGVEQVKAHESTHVSGGLDDIDSALAVAAMANLTTDKMWKGVAGRPAEVDPPTAALSSKVKAETRDITAVSGDVSYTGYGFTPTALIIFGAIPTTTSGSWGFSDSVRGEDGIWQRGDGGNMENMGARICRFLTTAGNYQTAVVKTYDADGFTLTWVKTGSPTGTANLLVLALK